MKCGVGAVAAVSNSFLDNIDTAEKFAVSVDQVLADAKDRVGWKPDVRSGRLAFLYCANRESSFDAQAASDTIDFLRKARAAVERAAAEAILGLCKRNTVGIV